MVITFSMLAFLLLLNGVFSPAFIQASIEMDKNNMMHEEKRIRNKIQADLEGMARTNRDWAVWDDSFLFLKGRQPDFVQVNLQDETFDNNRVNFILYFDGRHKPVYQGAYDIYMHKKQVLHDDFYKAFMPIVQSDEDSERTFMIHTSHGLAMAAVNEILTSNGEGPSAGTLIMGKYMNSEYIAEVAQALSLNVSLRKGGVGSGEKSGDKTRVVSETIIESEIPLLDYGSRSDYSLILQGDRHFYQEKKTAIHHSRIFLFAVSILFILLIQFLLERLILSRVYCYSLQLNAIQKDKNFKARIKSNLSFRDELSRLERSINKMLRSLEAKHDEIMALALHDTLTHLPNRILLEKEFRERTESQEGVAILFIDLDGFKTINDTWGHEAGDALLQQVANRIQLTIESHSTMAARFGGDEFVILSRKDVDVYSLAHRLLRSLEQDFNLGAQRVQITASIGLSASPDDGTTLDDLIKKADSAMYEAKRIGKNRVVVYRNQVTSSGNTHLQ
ncbi:sensor domain-containing diguanylate cyclase [Paenibacillus xanthanilyticus]|uniref:Diguanylate cyclase domain-containing protein n=1 Tax=Paenibacillus xanthanilyticus TaxID=1783531 RepID=A0ABV8K6I2_9BACL